jgi:hypothetical protein
VGVVYRVVGRDGRPPCRDSARLPQPQRRDRAHGLPRPAAVVAAGFLEEVAALARDGKISRQGLPRNYGALPEAAALAHRHRAMVTLLFPPMPPPFIQRLPFPLLTRLGEGRRNKPSQ